MNVTLNVTDPPAAIVLEDKAVVMGNSDVLVLATEIPDTDTVPVLVIVYWIGVAATPTQDVPLLVVPDTERLLLVVNDWTPPSV